VVFYLFWAMVLFYIGKSCGASLAKIVME